MIVVWVCGKDSLSLWCWSHLQSQTFTPFTRPPHKCATNGARKRGLSQMAKPLAIKETAKSSTQHACYKLTHTRVQFNTAWFTPSLPMSVFKHRQEWRKIKLKITWTQNSSQSCHVYILPVTPQWTVSKLRRMWIQPIPPFREGGNRQKSKYFPNWPEKMEFECLRKIQKKTGHPRRLQHSITKTV